VEIIIIFLLKDHDLLQKKKRTMNPQLMLSEQKQGNDPAFAKQDKTRLFKSCRST